MKKLFLYFSLAMMLAVCAVSPMAAQSQMVRLEGQVVCCAECWAEADRNAVEYGTAEDLLKAQSCVAGGDPTLIAVREGDRFKFYQLEQGEFRLPGQNWLEFVGKRIAVTGVVSKRKAANVVRVNQLNVLGASLAEREARAVVGQAIDLTLKDPFGGEQSLKQLKGRIVVLNFWATYCEPCRTEMPDLAEIQNEYAALGVQVVGASADEVGERAKVLQFVKETKINFPVWMGATVADMTRFGLGAALPGTVIIGRDGRIARVISGIVNAADLRKQIDLMQAQATAEATKIEEAATEEAATEEAAKSDSAKRKQTASAKAKPREASSVPS